jgi:hypothetical protein
VPTELFDPASVKAFHYERFELSASGVLACHYRLDDLCFVEHVHFDPPTTGPLALGAVAWIDDPAVRAAMRLVWLLAGVSYYKAAAPLVIDFGATALTVAERALLESFYRDGLGEYAFRNGLDLTELELRAPGSAPQPAVTSTEWARPLVPFGGGIDSIVTVESVRAHHHDTTLFVASRAGDRFAAIEQAAAVTGLPIRRADRSIDPKILDSRARGYRNGHVPVTGVLSAIAVASAVIGGHGTVVMSNEWSASSGNVDIDGRSVNHQFSKSMAFETAFRAVLAETFVHRADADALGVDYFSLLRPFSELAIAQRFATLTSYHDVFRSCNRAFHIDPAHRLDHWCGRCDKCCFIDLVLAPFLPRPTLERIFAATLEPLANTVLVEQFRTLAGLTENLKPFECVGDVTECAAAIVLAADRTDRVDDPLLPQLRDQVRASGAVIDVDRLMAPLGEHHIPSEHAPVDLLG